jgi:alkanesulfonate monooxygenase SsuD/methylene tetrahydromethanopterin reductase-like flavin-dependent oxidoreductase (luciferase family)
VGIFVFCSESEEKVQQAKEMMGYRFLSFEKGDFNRLYSYEDIKGYKYSAADQQRLLYHRNRFIAGTPDSIKKELTELAERFETNEIVVATFADKREDRFRSYELLADILINANAPISVNADNKGQSISSVLNK